MDFEGEDLRFYEELRAALPREVREDHEEHVIQILQSSSGSGFWTEETSMLRMGMRKSLDPDLRNPIKAAKTVSDLIASLEAFSRQGDGMEDWFFAVLDGVATQPDALIAFATYSALATGLAKREPEPATARAPAPPAGSGESEFGDDRDPALESESEFETSGVGREALAPEPHYLSTGEVYDE